MIQFAENLWVGSSTDGQYADVDAVLNVAKDLHIRRGWPDIQYAQVGLVDGPGNLPASYHAAVLTLAAMVKTGKRVLVHCHEGKSRSAAVVIMYLSATAGRNWPGDYAVGWDGWLKLLRVYTGVDLPEPHEAHKAAFEKMNWRLLATVMGD